MSPSSAASLTRHDLLPPPPAGMRRGLVLALLVHGLLVLGLAFNVNWRSSKPAGTDAELWAAVPQAAAPPEATPPEPEPKPESRPEPKPMRAEPVAAPKPQPDAQIAIEREKEKARKERQRKEEEQEALKQRKEREKKELQKREEQKREEQAEKAREEKKKKETEQKQKQQEAERQRVANEREAQLKRILSQAGNGAANSSGTAARSAGPSASYGGRIIAAIKPNIVFPNDIEGNPTAEVEVRVAPDGAVLARRISRSSGVKDWDDAVLRAIDKTERLPRDTDGRVAPQMTLVFRPKDLD